MGTSLSGLTPATTFDGLLKVGDNDPLTSTLKAISTGDGTDTMLELSTTALQIGGATGMHWDNTNSRLGIGTNAPSVPFEVYGGVRFRSGLNLNGGLTNSSTGKVDINNIGFFDTISNTVGIGESTPTSRLHIKGSGATSATTSLLVQNSDGANVLQTLDNGNVGVGTSATSNYRVTMTSGVLRLKDLLFGQTGSSAINNTSALTMKWNSDTGIGISGNGAIDATARLHIKGSGNDNTTTSLLVQNSDGDDMLKVTDDGITTLGTTGQQGEINLKRPQDGLAIGKIKGTNNGLYLTNQDASNHILIGNSSSRGVSVGDGSASAMGARFGIKGSGATAATTALLVQNSSGTDLFKVNDAGEIGLGATPTTNVRAYIKSAGSTAATNALVVQNSLSANLFKVQSDGKVYASNLRSTINSSSIELLQDVDFSGGDNYNFNSTTGGFLPPRMTEAERDAITTPAAGLMVYNTDTNTAE